MSILEVKNICKSFGDFKVLKGIDFSMEQGEVISVIGSSGSGKTTLLRCINFLETADKGQILVDGNVIFDHRIKSISAQKRFVNVSFISDLFFSRLICFRSIMCLKM